MTDTHQPAFSIIIPAYDKEAYIEKCLESILTQTFSDIEIIVVNDGSTDNTLDVIRSYVGNDARVKIIDLGTNKGRHCARNAGVAASTGKYILFVDADDDVENTLCEVLYGFVARRPDADIVRYGATVEADTAEEQYSVLSFEQMFNYTMGNLNDDDILDASFSSPHSPWLPWAVITSAFRGDIVRAAFSQLEDIRLNKVEDGYEYLAICTLSHTLYSFTEFKGLHYHFGRGISGRSKVEAEKFINDQRMTKEVDEAALRFAQRSASPAVRKAVNNFHDRNLMIIGDDFVARLTHDTHALGLQGMKNSWGAYDTYKALATHIYGHIKLESDSQHYPPSERYEHWKKIFQQTSSDASSSGTPLSAFLSDIVMQTQNLIDAIDNRAEETRLQIEEEQRRREYEESLRIFKSGTKKRKIFDRLFPLGTHRRGITRRIAKVILRR